MFPGTLLINSSSPRAPITTGTTTVFVCHNLLISSSRSLYFDSFSTILMDIFLSDGISLKCQPSPPPNPQGAPCGLGGGDS